MASMALPSPAEEAVPEWVHLLPKGMVETFDGRGPYQVEDTIHVIQASLADPRGIVIDENHSTDLAAPQGREAPARGWIVGLEERDDGLWGRVEWTRSGRRLLADRAYRGISPVIAHDKAGRVSRVVRASLVNSPNLRGLTALHSEDHDMKDLERVAAALGLAATATIDEVVSTAEELRGSTALQSALGEIGTALGIDGGDQATILLAAKAARAAADSDVSLHAEVTSLREQIGQMTTDQRRAASEGYVDGEFAKGRRGLNAQIRDEFVALHMEQPERATKLIEAMPIIGPGAKLVEREGAPGGEVVSLNAEQKAAAAALGVSEEAFLATLKAEAA